MQKRDNPGLSATSRNPVKAVHDARYAGNVTLHRGSPASHRTRTQIRSKLDSQEQTVQSGIGGILVPANRFPFSSTPTGSPTQPSSKGTSDKDLLAKDCNKSFKKQTFVSSVKENTYKKGTNSTKIMDPHSPIIKSKVHDFGHGNSDPISPIRATGRNREILHTLPSKDKRLMGRTGEPLLVSSSNDQAFSTSVISVAESQLSSTWLCEKFESKFIPATSIPFPCPEIGSFDSVDRDTVMVNNLRLLSSYKAMKEGDEKLEKKRRDGNHSTKRLKKKTSMNSSPNSMFSKGMFSAPNTPAFIHVYHLLFECYNPFECETEFRDACAWPVLDKKVESLFRRVVLKLLQTMFQTHPEHFSHIKQETLMGLINKPGGDRFIQLTESVIDIVLARVISDLGDNTQAILEKPKYSTDPEINNRQILCLKKATQAIFSRTCNCLERNSLYEDSMNQALDMLKNRETVWDAYTDGLLSSTEELLSEVQLQMNEFVIHLDNEISESWFRDLQHLLNKVDSETLDMNIGIEKLLASSASDSLKKITSLEETLNYFRRLRFILTKDRNKQNVIDGRKLCLLDDSKPATLANFYNSVNYVVKKVLADPYLNGPTNEDIIKQFKTVDLKFQYTKLVHQEINKSNNMDATDLESLRKYLLSSIHDLNMKLKNTNWSSYSNVYDESLVSLLGGTCLLTQVDLQQQTGLTPGINKFLSFQQRVKHSCDVTDGKGPNQQFSNRIDSQAQLINFVQIEKSITSEFQSSQTSQHYLENGTPNSSRNKQRQMKPRVSFVGDNQAAMYSSPDSSPGQNAQTDGGLPHRSSETTVVAAQSKARLSHILSSLQKTPSSPRSFTESRSSTNEDTLDDSAVSRRRSKRFSRSVTSRTSDTNLNVSLIDDWKGEIGIMDMGEDDCSFLSDSDDL